MYFLFSSIQIPISLASDDDDAEEDLVEEDVVRDEEEPYAGTSSCVVTPSSYAPSGGEKRPRLEVEKGTRRKTPRKSSVGGIWDILSNFLASSEEKRHTMKEVYVSSFISYSIYKMIDIS